MTNYKYNNLEKILHRQFLSESSPISNFLLKRLVEKSKKYTKGSNAKHIFITGLARSGTTAILNKLYESKVFGSILYKHMPFILSPSLAKYFSKLDNSQEKDYQERFHRDGIKFGPKSPECLDEVFWLRTSGKWFKRKYLKVYKPSRNQINIYAYLLSEFAKIEDKERMLIKNNNNHLRIIELSKFFTSSKFFILFRNPLFHSNSLLIQHANFCKLHSKDLFSLEYMNLVGHREFGNNYAPFFYPNQNGDIFLKYKPNSINYWLSQWIATYSWIHSVYKKGFDNVYLIGYEELCENKFILKKISELLEFNTLNSDNKFKLSNKNFSHIDHSLIDKDLLNLSNQIYDNLLEISFR